MNSRRSETADGQRAFVHETPRQLLTPDELSDWLQVPKQTLYKWRTCGDGPRGYRVGKHVRYDRLDVEHWLAAQN
jgi:excisionase family DNA binding protein